MLKKRIIIGARASPLSLAQAKEVSALLKEKFPQHSFSLEKLVTFGDKHLNWQRKDTGIFVKEIEEALLTGKIDLAVHSLKDLPCALPKGLALAAVTKRMDPRDCIIFRDNKATLSKPRKSPSCLSGRQAAMTFSDFRSGYESVLYFPITIKKGAHIGTSSLRRKAQLLYWRPDLQVENLRGNLDTRLEKLKSGGFDAIVVALAGIKRLGLKNLFIQIIPTKLILPAPGQGALGIEIRQDDTGIKALAEGLNDRKSFLCISSERAFLEALGAGCRLPLGVLAEIKDAQIHLEAVVASPDGKRLIRLSKRAPLDKAEASGLPSDRQSHKPEGSGAASDSRSHKAEALGKQLAQEFSRRGAKELLKEVN